jgi:hypothetical protein
MAEHDAHTDPRIRDTVPIEQVPYLIGQVRVASGEIRIAADMIAREAGGGPVYAAAHALSLHATRLGQWATMASALPAHLSAPPAPPPLEIVALGGRWSWARWRAAWGAFWRVWRA